MKAAIPTPLRFVTGNDHKFAEAEAIFKALCPELPLVQASLPLIEMQDTDGIRVARHKARQAVYRLGAPLFVEDVSLTFRAWKTLPGPLIATFWEALGAEGLIAALEASRACETEAPKTDAPKADASCVLVYHSGLAAHVFQASLAGAIVPPRGEGGFGWDRLFQPLGQPLGKRQTLAEMSTARKNRLSMRRLALAKMAHFLRGQGSLDAPRAPSTSTHARC